MNEKQNEKQKLKSNEKPKKMKNDMDKKKQRKTKKQVLMWGSNLALSHLNVQ